MDMPQNDSGEVPESLQFDRRDEDRWNLPGAATAFRLAGDRFGHTHQLAGLDYSAGGLGARCDEALEPGTVISLGFQSPGYLAKRGVVVRCIPCGEGYRVGVRFDARLAA